MSSIEFAAVPLSMQFLLALWSAISKILKLHKAKENKKQKRSMSRVNEHPPSLRKGGKKNCFKLFGYCGLCLKLGEEREKNLLFVFLSFVRSGTRL
jgi:hypothetical protein